jgi:hypothetical protein
MSTNLKTILKNRIINKWSLFCLISIPMSTLMVIAMMGVDMSTAPGVSEMIQFSVRWAVPFIFLVVAISSIQILFPGSFSMWLMRNRKYIGLCFAVAMAWQGLFIFIMSYFFHEYYYADVYFFRDEIEGSIGYIFLPAMVVTSFNFGRQYLNSKQWKLLHKSGIYFLWAYPFSVYWWNLSYYENPVPLDYVYYWGGFLAFALRIAAWGKQRWQATNSNAAESNTPLALKALGGAIIVFGLVWSAYGLYWQERVTDFLTTPGWSADLLLWLPFWPYEPYLSLFIIGLGTMLITKAKSADKAIWAVDS